MKNILLKIFGPVINWYKQRKLKKEYKKKLEELRKRDPFIYKNH
jgi:hypothetical protein